MKKLVIRLCAMACLPGLSWAQSAAADAAAPVPALQYRSVFAGMPVGVEQETLDWRAANAEVGQFRNGHVDILKWEENRLRAQPGATPSMPMQHAPAQPVPARP
jgi:hypothetical protein